MKTDFNGRVVEKIKELRIKQNISQNHIAKSLNLTVSAYNRIENNQTQLTLNNLFIISQTIGSTIEELLGLPPKHSFHNHNNLVMTNFNNGELHITLTEDTIKKLYEKGEKKEKG